MWKAHPEDLSLGIHPFCIGETSPDAIAQLQDLAQNFVRWGLSKPHGCPRASGRRQGLNPTKPHLARRPELTICGAAQSVLRHRAFRHSRLGKSYGKYSTATVEPPILHRSHSPPSATLTGLDPTLVPTPLLLPNRTPIGEHERPRRTRLERVVDAHHAENRLGITLARSLPGASYPRLSHKRESQQWFHPEWPHWNHKQLGRNGTVQTETSSSRRQTNDVSGNPQCCR
jgi:hypothetical protein